MSACFYSPAKSHVIDLLLFNKMFEEIKYLFHILVEDEFVPKRIEKCILLTMLIMKYFKGQFWGLYFFQCVISIIFILTHIKLIQLLCYVNLVLKLVQYEFTFVSS